MPEIEHEQSSVFNRAWSQIARTFRDIGPRKRGFDIALKPNLPKSDEERLIEAFQECIDGRGGEVQARARAAALGQAYLALDDIGQRRFAEVLAVNFDVDPAAVDAAIAKVQSAANAAERAAAETLLRDALEAPRMRVLTQFNALPDGVKFLVDLRAELLRWQVDRPALAGLQDDLKRLLTRWFDVGFLELRQLDWDSPATLLEKLIRYEAVHRIRSWDDLKNRLDMDRRCYAFFHPRMPNEPLIFIEVALVEGMAGDVGVLLEEVRPADDPAAADTAIFYSISNAQQGLAGISFGDFLIKRVAGKLSSELPNIKTFATLSPIPGLMQWIRRSPDEAGEKPFSPDERDAIRQAIVDAGETIDAPTNGVGEIGDLDLLHAALAVPKWHENAPLAKALEPVLTRLAADYLFNRRGRGGRCLDPVAHFHLSNGARMERLNWLGDVSANGLKQSAGMMINYLYELSEIDQNHESYSAPSRKVVASNAIKAAAKR